jgi:ABC-2 type transport system permease protein
VIYFVMVAGMFVAFTVLRVQEHRMRLSRVARYGRYAAVVAVVLGVGYVGSRPRMMSFVDMTSNKRQTLTEASREIVDKLDGPLTITTFCNVLDPDFAVGAPENVKNDQKIFSKYVRFKPETRLRYVYYYAPPVDTSIYARYPGEPLEQIARKVALTKRFNPQKLKTPEQVALMADLRPEQYRFVRLIERGSGERSFLRIFDDLFRQPGEAEISAALKKLIVEPVKVGFLTGHGEREIYRAGDGDYSIFATSLPFRGSMINRGFDLVPLDLETMDDIGSDIRMLIVADMRTPLSAHEQQVVDRYIARGDNMMILGDARRGEAMNPLLGRFGVSLREGVLVQPDELYAPVLIAATGTDRTHELGRSDRGFWATMNTNPRNAVMMNGASALDTIAGSGFDMVPLFATRPESVWLDMNLERLDQDRVVYDSLAGERKGAYLTAVAKTRMVGDRQQRVMILGDADCMSNLELQMSNRGGLLVRNGAFIIEAFSWLSNGEFPVRVAHRPVKGTSLSLVPDGVARVRIVYCWVVPLLFALAGVAIWLRRRRG